jgi:hypothetical protein
MILVSIAGDERSVQDANADWIVQQIERRRRDGLPVCVVVTIRTSELQMRLATPECGGGGGRRLPTGSEAGVFGLWSELGLNQSGFAPGKVIAFLRRLKV